MHACDGGAYLDVAQISLEFSLMLESELNCMDSKRNYSVPCFMLMYGLFGMQET